MVVVIGGNGRARSTADSPAYDRSVPSPYLVANVCTQSAANRSTDGGVKTLIVGECRCGEQSGPP
jgi:hypothetical protein